MNSVKNNLKYKNQITFLGKLKKKLHEVLDMSYQQSIVVKYPVSVESYKYLNRHLVKLNRVFKGSVFITLNKSEYAGEMGYLVVVNLKVTR